MSVPAIAIPEVLQGPRPNVLVVVTQENEEGLMSVLLVKSGAAEEKDELQYTMVGGGRKPGQTIEDAVFAELQEEIGIETNQIDGVPEILGAYKKNGSNPKPAWGGFVEKTSKDYTVLKIRLKADAKPVANPDEKVTGVEMVNRENIFSPRVIQMLATLSFEKARLLIDTIYPDSDEYRLADIVSIANLIIENKYYDNSEKDGKRGHDDSKKPLHKLKEKQIERAKNVWTRIIKDETLSLENASMPEIEKEVEACESLRAAIAKKLNCAIDDVTLGESNFHIDGEDEPRKPTPDDIRAVFKYLQDHTAQTSDDTRPVRETPE